MVFKQREHAKGTSLSLPLKKQKKKNIKINRDYRPPLLVPPRKHFVGEITLKECSHCFISFIHFFLVLFYFFEKSKKRELKQQLSNLLLQF